MQGLFFMNEKDAEYILCVETLRTHNKRNEICMETLPPLYIIYHIVLMRALNLLQLLQCAHQFNRSFKGHRKWFRKKNCLARKCVLLYLLNM
jgi:hypothetical protein